MYSKGHEEAAKAYKRKGVTQDPDNSWYLAMVMVHPEHQGKGHLSRIWKDALNHDPTATFSLESTSAASIDRYAHFGFEVRLGQSLARFAGEAG